MLDKEVSLKCSAEEMKKLQLFWNSLCSAKERLANAMAANIKNNLLLKLRTE